MSVPALTKPDAAVDPERALLGALLHLPTDKAAELIDGLVPSAFADSRNRSILAAVRGAVEAGDRPDPVVVRARLLAHRDDGVRFLDDDDPGLLLAELLTAVPVVSSADLYRRLVLEAAGLREREARHTRMRQALDRRDVELFDELAHGTVAEIPTERPTIVALPDFLAVPDEVARFRVEGIWPVGGRCLLAAQYKAGKTTMLDNLLRALVDDEPFLGQFTVTPPAGRVVIIDNELDVRMLRRWLREQGIRNTERVSVLSLRGRVGTFDLRDPVVRRGWVKQLRDVQAAVVLFDCLRPVLDALNLSEDKEAGRFLVAFDALLQEAGVGEAALVHHMGHQGERSRGDSRLRDWPDVTWTLVREVDEHGEQHADSPRYFSALGRDVLIPEGQLTYDHDSRRLTLAGGTRRETKAAAGIPEVLTYLEQNPGATQRAVEAALKDVLDGGKAARAALKTAIQRGLVDLVDGPRRSHLHFLTTPSAPSAPTSEPAHPAQSVNECASAPIGGARRTHSAPDPEQQELDPAHSALDEGWT